MRIVYESLYRSIMEYGLIVWDKCTDIAMKSLLVPTTKPNS